MVRLLWLRAADKSAIIFDTVMSVQPAKTCYLRTDDKSLLTVYLPDRKSIFLGRCPETNITDTKCSRQQVRLYADYAESKVFLQQVGTRPSGLNGFKMTKDVKVTCEHNDRLEMLYGKYPYQIEFNPPPSLLTLLSKKRPREPVTDNDAAKSCKMLKSEDTSTDDKSTKGTESEEDFCNVKEASDERSNEMSTTDDTSAAESWESIDDGELLIYTAQGVRSRRKVAAYDMDGTLIKTRSGLVFPKDCNDWQLLYPDVPGKLKRLHGDGYKIVIFTNQGRLGSGKVKLSDFKSKIERIVAKIGVGIQAFIATGPSAYRKPAIGMWEELEKNRNGNTPIDKANSFYVGDAAGRGKNWAPGKKKDHSNVDRLMALNINIRFETPEEHFLGHPAVAHVLPKFNPKTVGKGGEICDAGCKVTANHQEMILMVGCPGSGKSHFARTHLKDYGYVNRDSLGSWQKCVKKIENDLLEKKSVVVDNTNANGAARQRYIDAARKHGVPVRCFVMSTSADHAKHNNRFRELTDPSHTRIGEMVLNSFWKSYVQPSLDEGFSEIVEINCVPKFQSEEHRKLYEMYLLEH